MISKSALHVVRAMLVLADLPNGKCAGSADIAKKIEAPPNYLGKLLQSLVPIGLVDSQKGYGGGFRLARPAKSITLLEVVDSIDQVSRWSGCLLGRGHCSEDTHGCALHEQWGAVREQYLKLLRETSIADVSAQEMEHIAAM